MCIIVINNICTYNATFPLLYEVSIVSLILCYHYLPMYRGDHFMIIFLVFCRYKIFHCVVMLSFIQLVFCVYVLICRYFGISIFVNVVCLVYWYSHFL